VAISVAPAPAIVAPAPSDGLDDADGSDATPVESELLPPPDAGAAGGGQAPAPAVPVSRPRPPAAAPAPPEPPSAEEPDARPAPPAAVPAPPAAEPDPPPPPPAPTVAPPRPIERFPGHYAFSGGAAQRGKIADAVEAVVGEMSLISRGIARDRLLESSRPPSSIGIVLDGKKLLVMFGARVYTTKLGAPSVRVTGSSGDDLDFRAWVRGEQLRLEFRGKKGGKTYVMRKDARDRLRLHVTIFSSSLPKDVVYDLTYRNTK
jgi:hypothetical protein